MKKRVMCYITGLIMLISISTYAHAQDFDLEGHRGARGLMPENSIPGFIKALDLGVTTLEMDVVISKDSMVVVSHESYFNSSICLDPDGNEIPKKDEKDYNIYRMDYSEILDYDCGSKFNSQFPDQEKMPTVKPLLKDVIKAVEAHIKGVTKYLVNYNIEIKSSPENDNIFTPTPDVFSVLVYDQINKYLDLDRIVIQSFDFRTLGYWHEKYPEITLAALVSNMKSIQTNLDELGFKPDIYSPHFKLLDLKKVEKLHADDIKVIPWTVLEPEDMQKLVDMGVDGLITDYPDRAATLGLAIEVPYKGED